MTEHRASYVKTTVLAASVSALSFASIAWCLKAFSSTKSHPIFSWLFGLSIASIGLIYALAGLILIGSIICLRRDSREDRGFPYVSRRPREWYGGSVIRGLRRSLHALGRLGHGQSRRLVVWPGERVKIRPLNEIMATLDAQGRLESLPFTPEMAFYCGVQARVFRRVERVFDWILSGDLKRMQHTVILEALRCDGRYHGECQAGCQMLWKEDWLIRTNDRDHGPLPQEDDVYSRTELQRFTRKLDAVSSEQSFVCQMTELPRATLPLTKKRRLILFEDLRNGNLRPRIFLIGIAIKSFNFVQRRCKGAVFPYRPPIEEKATPHSVLNLQPGDLVRVKSKHEIEATLNSEYKNRGLWFDPEMSRFCGGTYHVLARISRQIEEKTGKMINIQNPCIVLEGVTASGEYHAYAPLNELIYWREIWLERV